MLNMPLNSEPDGTYTLGVHQTKINKTCIICGVPTRMEVQVFRNYRQHPIGEYMCWWCFAARYENERKA